MPETLIIGDRVTYVDINLRDYRGVVVALGRTRHGGDATVSWSTPVSVTGQECLATLKKREVSTDV